jgi:hypothetical protein
LSSAILYLAIVAIWAVVLVPRWLHPRSAQPEPVEPVPVPVPEPAEPEATEREAAERETAEPVPQPAGADRQDRAGPVPGEPAPAFPSPAERRGDILRARRRMLTALVVLTAGAVGLAVTGIAPSWVIVPPAVLLGGFLLLLREAAHIDAERARRATRSRYAEVPPVAGQEPESFAEGPDARPEQVPATASVPDAIESQPRAEVIDISARLSDQVYDQYSDAAERAVGD